MRPLGCSSYGIHMTSTAAHGSHCIELAVMAIAENNAYTAMTEPGRELAPETEATALEWLENGNLSCHYEGDEAAGYPSCSAHH